MSQRRAFLGSSLAFACAVALMLAACGSNKEERGDGGSATDASVVADAGVIADSGTDAETALPDSRLPPCAGELPVMSAFDSATGMYFEPDWSCYESREDEDADAAPQDAGADRPAILQLTYAPGNKVPFPGEATVDVFFGPSALGEPAFTGVTDADAGTIMFIAPAEEEFVSVWVHATRMPASPLNDIVDLYELSLPIVRPPAMIGASVLISSPVDSLLANVLGSRELGDRSKAILSAVVRDCRGHDVGGAQLELIDAEKNAPVPSGTAAGEPRTIYARFALPDPTCTYTSPEGSEWLMVNAPTNVSDGALTHAYRVRATGRMRASDSAPVTLGEPAVELSSGGFTVARPYRISRR
jgi:hypothetical protein